MHMLQNLYMPLFSITTTGWFNPYHAIIPQKKARSLAYFARSLVFLARSASGLPLVCRFWSMKMAASAGPQRMEIARTRQNSMLTWWKNPADWRLKCHFMSLPLMIVHHRRSIFLLWWKYSTHPALTILLGFPKFEISITEATFRSTRYNQHANIAAPKWHSFWKGNLPIRKHSCFGPT